MPPASNLPDWARYLGPPRPEGLIRCSLEDFHVEEIPLVDPLGEGNHLWLEVEKRGANTQWVATQLAAAAAVKPRDVGFAGMKDRHGVTTQWFSIGLQEAGNDDWASWSIDGVRVLGAQRHNRKLKRGALLGNRFRIIVRDMSGPGEDLRERLEIIRSRGVPNYFGPQRFGHGGLNVDRARAWLRDGGRIRRDKRSIYLSAARSFLFNNLLSKRVEEESWDRLLDGDVAILDGRRSVFACDPLDEELEARCSRMEIHPTGSMPGRGGVRAQREAGRLEQETLDAYPELLQGLERAGLGAARRSLRMPANALEWDFKGSSLELRFELQSGCFATSLLRELVNVKDAAMFRGSE